MRIISRIAALVATAICLAAPAAVAQSNDGVGELPIIGVPSPGGIGFQPAATGLARDLQWLDGMILVIITVIVLFVTGLLGWVIYRYNHRRNATPARFTHHTPIEIAWTVVPIVILMFIGAYSLPVLFEQQEIPEGDVTITATGHQWYWSYEYPEQGFAFDSFMIGQGENHVTEDVRQQLQEAGYSEDEFKLATDTAMVVPVNKTIVVQVTASDVIHSWTVPAFGVKQDGIPGRMAALWFEADQEGIYFGQCSELCGQNHAYMPITVKVVSQSEYDAWVERTAEEFASTGSGREEVQVASVQ